MAGWGDDIAYGGAGNDGITTGNGNDIVYGGSGNDQILSGVPYGISADTVFGGSGDDQANFWPSNTGTFNGGSGDDTLSASWYEFDGPQGDVSLDA